MGRFTDATQNALFVYTQDDSGRFWVFDGRLFHRFMWNQEGLWYIRTQVYLPECSYGKCLTMNDHQRQVLEEEAARHKIALPIFDNEAACTGFAVSIQHNQFVFDCTYPGGFFYSS